MTAPGVSGAIGRVLALVLRAFAVTWRVDPADVERLEKALTHPVPLLVGFWHGVYLPLIPLLRDHAGCVFVGEGLRGRWIASICESLGFTPILLPHHDRRRALARMRMALRGPLPCATPLDGPHGPERRVKPALIEIASELGAAILPLSLSVQPTLVLGWRWDHRIVPLPFARISLFVGAPVRIPLGAGAETQALLAARVAAAVDALPVGDDHASASVGSRVKGTNATGSS